MKSTTTEGGYGMTTTTDTRKRFRFFLDHAGYSTPPGRAACALELARTEQLLERAIDLGVARVEWVDDDEPYDYNPHGRGFEDDDADYAARQFDSNAWTGPYGCVLCIGPDEPTPNRCEQSMSLWGIVVGPRGTDDPYCRVVAAELADEVADELRQAIGDALDSNLCVG